MSLASKTITGGGGEPMSLSKKGAIARAAEAFGASVWGERYPGKTTRCFGVEHHAVALYAIGRVLRNGGREVLGRGTSWDEALENAISRHQILHTRDV